MVKQVIKRDGRVVEFDRTRIEKAIEHAFNAAEIESPNGIASKIADSIFNLGNEKLSVEQIQDYVEDALIKEQCSDVAKRYILYRHKRDCARQSSSNEIISDIIAAKKNDITRENANMNADTPAGMMMKVSSERTKEYVDDFLLSDEVSETVKENIIHIHDKDYYPTKSLTCLQHPMDKILGTGFKAGHGESRPAKRIETASILSCISMETIQNRFCSL